MRGPARDDAEERRKTIAVLERYRDSLLAHAVEVEGLIALIRAGASFRDGVGLEPSPDGYVPPEEDGHV